MLPNIRIKVSHYLVMQGKVSKLSFYIKKKYFVKDRQLWFRAQRSF